MFDVIADTVRAFSRMRVGLWEALGEVLLVGEGNLSFARSLFDIPTAHVTQMTATTFETEGNLSEEVLQNTAPLRRSGATIMHGVDATRLDRHFGRTEFDTIIFQFPNVGSRDATYGRNPNYILVRKFLRSAAEYLSHSGKVLITAVDSPHYQGAFQFDEAAKFAGYETPRTYLFDPAMFSGYSHINTNDEDSALDGHNRFATWVFRLKK